MKFVVDAQLPRRIARDLAAAGHEVLHSLDLPQGNRTPDDVIAELADRESRVVVTKDSDFVTSHLLRGSPSKLLLISTGNITNDALSRLLAANLPALVAALSTHSFVELNASAMTIHS